ncbi:MAG: hypothetical protein PHH54_06570 [Candidatus Nanoarchaeia archaeon]|nr:hypothetical protein [Candidatus Nanoarchaeia archaeon]MDD5741620.1 hypothetical protein [Candidatus Nanoarchaeia archaeon]
MKQIYLDNAGKLSYKDKFEQRIPFLIKGNPKTKHCQWRII